ncbi:MAG: permease [Candidatus Hadarchaeota archaeon]
MIFDMIADYIVSLTGLSGRAAEALNFWIYDSLKISFILFLVILGVGFVRTYVKPEKVREYLKGKHSILGYLGAAVLGIVSPFCSCSTIPLFLGFVGAGVPFGMTITFLFVSPMVNEASVVVLFGILGWKITLLYVIGGVAIGVAGGYSLTKLGFEKYVREFDIGDQDYSEKEIGLRERSKMAYREAKEIVKSVIPYVLIGVGIGAVVHGYVPQEVVTEYLTGSLAVPAAVAVGVPIYTNIMGVIPVVESLIGKGLPVGTSIAFMMSVAALSLPQFVMLKKVMEKRLIVTYALMISIGIILLGLMFNFFF